MTRQEENKQAGGLPPGGLQLSVIHSSHLLLLGLLLRCVEGEEHAIKCLQDGIPRLEIRGKESLMMSIGVVVFLVCALYFHLVFGVVLGFLVEGTRAPCFIQDSPQILEGVDFL